MITELEPKIVWKWFAKICQIPHPSYHEQALALFIINWANSKNFIVKQDSVGNILIAKDATHPDLATSTVCLQAHLDMVSQKEPHSEHDFEKDAILTYIDNGWVKATNTTLGADNGIGLASTLAILDSDNIAHPNLEVLLTVQEEVGMGGAINLKQDFVHSNYLINTDAANRETIFIGCAGRLDAYLTMPLQYQKHTHSTWQTLSLKISGALGGHSGLDIDQGRANALQLLAHLLKRIETNITFALIGMQGGEALNAIPRLAEAKINIQIKDLKTFPQLVQELFDTVKSEYIKQEPHLSLELITIDFCAESLTPDSQNQLLDLLLELPNSVQTLSNTEPQVVETSLNLSKVLIEKEQVSIILMIRSLVETGTQKVAHELEALTQKYQAPIEFKNKLPGWAPESSALLTKVQQSFQYCLHKNAQIAVIHAGLECGLIKAKYPEMQLISMGVDIENPHSPTERVSISSVQSYWQVLIHLLQNFDLK